MITKQRGVIDPYTLGFLLSLTGLVIVQPWDRSKEDATEENQIKLEKTISDNHQLQQAELGSE